MPSPGAEAAPPPAIHEAGIYRIRVTGRLGPEWANRLEGLSVEAARGADGEWRTVLTGTVTDHAALMGTLDRLALHGARLLEVRCLGTADLEESNDSVRGSAGHRRETAVGNGAARRPQ